MFSGKKSIVREGTGNNQHFFWQSKSPYEIASDEDEFFAYVFLDPIDPPKQVMLQFNDGTWEHRAVLGQIAHSLWPGKHRWKSQNGRTAQDRRMDPSRCKRQESRTQAQGQGQRHCFHPIRRQNLLGQSRGKIDPRPALDPTLSLAKWTDTVKSDKNLHGGLAKAAKKAAKDRSEKESQLLRRHFLAYVFPKVPEGIKKFREEARKLEQESTKALRSSRTPKTP